MRKELIDGIIEIALKGQSISSDKALQLESFTHEELDYLFIGTDRIRDRFKGENVKKIHSNIKSFLGELIENHKDYFREENTFKVRPGVAYDKFYINQVEGSYDMSLQGLLHHYLWENELYHLFLITLSIFGLIDYNWYMA